MKYSKKDIKNRLKQLIPRWIDMYQDSSMSAYSGNATLLIVTAMFPFMILIISIVNLLPGYSADDVADILCQLVPVLDTVKVLIKAIVADLKDQSGGLLASAAAITTLWAASKGVSAIQRGLNHLDSDEDDDDESTAEKGKDLLKRVLKRLLFTLLLVILIPAILVFKMLGSSIAVAVVVFTFLVILLIYALLPEKRRSLKSQLPGAILTTVCWIAFTELFSFFIKTFYHASNIYGSLASVFMVLLWLRIMVMILFGGGVLNRTLEEEKETDP